MARSSAKDRPTLDQRRETLHTRRSAAEETASRLTELDAALEANAVARRDGEARLQSALDQVAGLKKAIKAAKKERGTLRTARDEAREQDAQARQRAASAERKYDRAMLADMVSREKDQDLAADRDAGQEPTPKRKKVKAAPKARAAAAGLPPAAGELPPAADEPGAVEVSATTDDAQPDEQVAPAPRARGRGARRSSTKTAPRV
ncbi:MAG TPA: hypothetical protein VGH99_16795 [Pseudonocardia sp.]|jgi:chromosome segregation ATPase